MFRNKNKRIEELEAEIEGLTKTLRAALGSRDGAREERYEARLVATRLAELLGIAEHYRSAPYDLVRVRSLKDDLDIISRAEETEGARKRLGLTKEEA